MHYEWGYFFVSIKQRYTRKRCLIIRTIDQNGRKNFKSINII